MNPFINSTAAGSNSRPYDKNEDMTTVMLPSSEKRA